MDNIIATLAERVSPTAMAAPITFLTNSSVSHASDLFSAFTNEEQDNTKLSVISSMVALTCKEFAEQCKSACAMADANDKLNGFVVPANAKGQDKYGPKRQVFNARMSDARQLFGVFKVSPSTLAEKGYHKALKAAREYLKAAGVKWDGTPVEKEEDKTVRQQNELLQAAMQETMKANPMKAGESIKDYQARISDIAEDYLGDATARAEEEAVYKVVKKMAALGTPEVVAQAALRICEQFDIEGLKAAMEVLQYALSIAVLGEEKEQQG